MTDMDVKDRLNRIADRVADRQPSLRELERARSRRTARRRIGAGVVGLAVAVGGLLGVWTWASSDQSSQTVEAADPTVPAVLEVTCEGETASVRTPVVTVQPDGNHVLVQVPSGIEAVGFWKVGYTGGLWANGGKALDGEFVQSFGTGEFLVGCFEDESALHQIVEPTGPGFAPFTVIPDSAGSYVDMTLQCSDGAEDFALTPSKLRNEGEPMVEFIRRAVSGIESTDFVEEAGFVASEQAQFRIVRDGEVIAWLDAPSEFVMTGQACGGSGIEGL